MDTTLVSSDSVASPIDTTLVFSDWVDSPIDTTLVFSDAVCSPMFSKWVCAEPPAMFTSPVICINDAVILPSDLNIRLSFDSDIAVGVIANPPISPVVAVTVPSISRPAADADRTVVFASVFISKALLVILTCLPDVGPTVVVSPNDAVTWFPFLTSTELLSIKTFWFVPSVLPNVTVSVYSANLLLKLSKISTPVLVNETLDAIDWDAVVSDDVVSPIETILASKDWVDSPIDTTLASNDSVACPIETTDASNDSVACPIETTLASNDSVVFPIATTLVFNEAVCSPMFSKWVCAEPPAIFTSPVICINEAVILPSDLSIKRLLDSDIAFDVIANPPISPVVAVTVPSIETSPSFVRWNLLELISMFPFEPLMNWASPPKKNFGVLMSTELPLMFTFSTSISTLEPLILPPVNKNLEALTWPLLPSRINGDVLSIVIELRILPWAVHL